MKLYSVLLLSSVMGVVFACPQDLGGSESKEKKTEDVTSYYEDYPGVHYISPSNRETKSSKEKDPIAKARAYCERAARASRRS